MAKMMYKTNQINLQMKCLVCFEAILLNFLLCDGEAFSSEMVAHLLNLKEEEEEDEEMWVVCGECPKIENNKSIQSLTTLVP